MRYLHPKTLEFLMYILVKGDLLEVPPYEFYTKLFASDINYILDDLKKYKIYDCFEIDDTVAYQVSLTDMVEYSGITLSPHNKPDVESFMNEYINEFEENNLKENYYSFEKHKAIITKSILEPYYDKFGKRFDIDYNFEDANFSFAKEILQEDFDLKKFRLYEILLYLNRKKYITINKDFDFVELKTPLNLADENTTYVLSINITLKKMPAEIYDISKYWLYYGDIRVNETDGIAFYKQHKYFFRNVKGKAFKFLCYLLINHGKWIPIADAYNAINPEDINISFDTQRGRIKDYVKEIKSNLNITIDENPSIFITTNEACVMLISNPPK